MKISTIISLLFFFISSNLFSQYIDEKDEQIKGKWEYKVAQDSIAYPMIENIKTKNKIFFDFIEFKKDDIFKAKSNSKILSGEWFIIGNNLILNFVNKTSILYEIMRLSNTRLELKEEGMLSANLGFDRK